MYFVGTYFYVSTMVNDLAKALDGHDKVFRDKPIGRMGTDSSQQALVNEIRFHCDILAYGF